VIGWPFGAADIGEPPGKKKENDVPRLAPDGNATVQPVRHGVRVCHPLLALAFALAGLASACGELLGLGTNEEKPDDPPSSSLDGGADVLGDATADGGTSSDASLDAEPDGPSFSCASCASKHCQSDGGCDPLVFVTNAAFAGNFAAGTVEGVQRADGFCDSAAAGKLAGKFLAWMSGANVNPQSRFTKTTRPYWLPNNTKVADSYEALKTSGPLVPINIDEANVMLPNGARAWTGTTTGGLSKAQTCSDGFGDWRSGSAKGMLGETHLTTYQWTDAAEGTCGSVTAHIYCFEQQP
jgi:hypothetical protein